MYYHYSRFIKPTLPLLIVIIFVTSFFTSGYGQGCCAGGSGSPIAGGSSQGVLAEKQMEISSSFQYSRSDKFKLKDSYTDKFFDDYNSTYLYNRIGYGLSKSLTFSVEGGYFFNKTQIGLNRSDTIKTSGFADLILFPRYNVFKSSNDSVLWDLTLGMGYKIPIGSHVDSTLVFVNPNNGREYYTISPPLVQSTTGSHDVILYGFLVRGFPRQKFQLYASTLYISKGWNSLGEKFGDYASLGLFYSKKIRSNWILNMQIRGDMVRPMQSHKNIDLLALYNVDLTSTGSRKVALIPQVVYRHNSLVFFAMSEFPLYEYVNGSQVASKRLITGGLAYRFYVPKSANCEIPDGNHAYVCPMRCNDSGSDEPGKCKVCGMDLEKSK